MNIVNEKKLEQKCIKSKKRSSLLLIKDDFTKLMIHKGLNHVRGLSGVWFSAPTDKSVEKHKKVTP